MLDLTSSLDVAGAFAAPGPPGSCGLLGLVPRRIGGDVRIVDLTQHPKALRPQLQHAFGFFSNAIADLKAQTALDGGVRWLRFTRSQDDWVPVRGYSASLLDAHGDPVAGVIQLLLDSYPKWNDWTAKWLADHVAPAPFIMRHTPRGLSGGLEYDLVSASVAGLTFDLAVERFNNHRIWSNVYPDTRAAPALENLRSVLAG